MVRINCEVDVTANTFEDALLEVQSLLRALHTASHDDVLAYDYHHWNVENEGDVDWYPFTERTANGRSSFHVENT